MEFWSLFLTVTAVIFGITLLVLLSFPVRVYEEAKQSKLRDRHKGLFANTIISLYEIKQHGLDAEGQYWWHLVWFNTAVSLGTSVLITTGLFIVLGLLLLVLMFAVLAALLNS